MIAVLDASVALKWQFEDEEATGAATALLEDFVEGKIELIAPTLHGFTPERPFVFLIPLLGNIMVTR